QMGSLDELNHLVRAGANRSSLNFALGARFGRFFVYNENSVHHADEPGGRVFRFDYDCEVVRRFDGGDCISSVYVPGNFGISQPLEGVLDVGGSEWISVVKLDTLAQV